MDFLDFLFPRECRICHQEKEQWEFWRDNNTKDGWHTACAVCLADQKANPVGRRRFQTIENNKKCCRRCNKWKALHEFRRSKAALSGYESSCKFCHPRCYRRLRTVSVIPLRVAVESHRIKTGESYSSIALRCGPKGADTGWLKKRLGLVPNRPGEDKQTRVHERIAKDILEAIGKEPYMVGL